MKNNIVYGAIFLILSTQAFAAQVDENKTVTNVAVTAGNAGYFKIAETFTLPCKYNVMYFDIKSPSGKGYLSVLLSAKMSGKKLSLIVYEQDANNICTLLTVEI